MQARLYSGTGNLLWVAEILHNTQVFVDPKWARLAIELCREQGDGLMLVSERAPYQAYFINPDGSNGLFCGNGVRCLAYHLVTQHKVASPVMIHIADLDISCDVLQDQVSIQLPKRGVESLGVFDLQVFDDLHLSGFRMNMPNPHWVILKEVDLDSLERIGKRVNELDGMNIEFVFQNAKGLWHALVYERGAGITEACGSGALAVLCVLQEQDLIATGKELSLRMLGGVLTLQDLGTHLSLKGQVRFIKDRTIHAF